MSKRPQARSAAAGSDADAKKANPRVHTASLTITIPFNTDPESPKLTGSHASQHAARKANEVATSEFTYHTADYGKLVEPFAAAVASASAKKGRPVTLTEVTTEMTNMTYCRPKFVRSSVKERLVWRGFQDDRWKISRFNGSGLVAVPKGYFPKDQAGRWRFSPSPGARRPLAELSCEPAPRSSAGCVVC